MDIIKEIFADTERHKKIIQNDNLNKVLQGRIVINERAECNSKQKELIKKEKLKKNILYYKTIVKTQEEKDACDAILNSNYSVDDKEYLFNDGLFRTKDELKSFELEKKREKFVNSGEWASYCDTQNWIANCTISFIILDFFIGIISFFCSAFSITVVCTIAFIPLCVIALIINLITSSNVASRGKEYEICDDYTKKAKVEQVTSVAGLVASGASIARNTKKFVKDNKFV